MCAALAACFSALLLCATPGLATPFADVPANHWAYTYLQALVADGVIDGYPDGLLHGDRALSRYEMATIVARVIARLHERDVPRPSRADLDKLQKLVDALKDELDGLGVRVTNVEDELASLNSKTRTASAFTIHGQLTQNGSFRQRTLASRAIDGSLADPFVTAFLSTDETNDPFAATNSGIELRTADRIVLGYRVSDNLAVSLPVHVLNFEYGGAFAQQSKFDVEPGVKIDVASAGPVQNLELHFGALDDMRSSRTGLAFRAPSGGSATPFEQPLQPFQKGVSIAGSIFGLTDVRASFSRVDQVLLNTQNTTVLDPTGTQGSTGYLFPIVVPQNGYTQTVPAGQLATDAFSGHGNALAQVYLSKKAILGSIYISYYDGTLFDAQGNVLATSPGSPAAPPPFVYNDAYNALVFAPALAADARIVVSYTGVALSTNTNLQRYMINARIDHKIKGLPGAAIGLTFNRIFDFDDLSPVGNGTIAYGAAPQASGPVSDTVFGVDAQVPILGAFVARNAFPILYGEVARSTFSPDFRSTPALSDSAGVLGVRAQFGGVETSVQYQNVGAKYLDGAPYRYYGNAPSLFAFYKGAYVPEFFGNGNTSAINAEFDAQLVNGPNHPLVAQNPNLTFAYPVFNPFRSTGPTFFQAFTPNSRGMTASLAAPLTIAGRPITARAQYQHLEQINPDSGSTANFAPTYPTQTKLALDSVTLGAQARIARRVSVGVSGTYETLKRPDYTAQQYYPIDPVTGKPDAAAVAAAEAAFPTTPVGGQFAGGGSQIPFYPNFVDIHRYGYTARAAVGLTRNVGVDLAYGSQRYGGSYGTTASQNISQRKDYLEGNVTYTIPKTNSTVSFQARNYRYSDDVVPSYNFNQNRQDINFTIRF